MINVICNINNNTLLEWLMFQSAAVVHLSVQPTHPDTPKSHSSSDIVTMMYVVHTVK